MAHMKAFNKLKSYTRLSVNRYAVSRIVFTLTALFFAVAIFYGTEFRRRSWSCKTLASCFGGRSHSYQHWDDVDPDFKLDVFEKTLHDGTLMFHRQTVQNSSPGTLLLVLAQDSDSWSKDYRSTRRNIYDYLDLLVSTNLDFTNVTLGFMTSTREEYEKARDATEKYPFARVELYLKEDQGPKLAYADRHKPHVQRQRRAHIATLRNFLMLRTLRDESHIVWIDADVVEVSPNIIQTMQRHAEKSRGVSLITALCTQTRAHNYDRHTWAFHREKLSSHSNANQDEKSREPLDILGTVSDDRLSDAVKEIGQRQMYVPELIENTHNNDLLHVDSVGATILYMRADLVRQGISFPPYNVIGTTWSNEGWSGIETEGICFIASQIGEGHGCFVLGGNHYVRHADIS
ncbi:Anp1-domain-containing protein [Xylariaceae sp. FL1272]|nr:Anp1-domain-containing protein [Xylariaceae sp. FL1272]